MRCSRPIRSDFPDLDESDGRLPLNCNEGAWDYRLEELRLDTLNNRTTYLLTLDLERDIFLDEIKVDVRETLVRVLAAGRLFQIRLPERVDCVAAQATRSRATGKLRITMPAGHSLSMTVGECQDDTPSLQSSD